MKQSSNYFANGESETFNLLCEDYAKQLKTKHSKVQLPNLGPNFIKTESPSLDNFYLCSVGDECSRPHYTNNFYLSKFKSCIVSSEGKSNAICHRCYHASTKQVFCLICKKCYFTEDKQEEETIYCCDNCYEGEKLKLPPLIKLIIEEEKEEEEEKKEEEIPSLAAAYTLIRKSDPSLSISEIDNIRKNLYSLEKKKKSLFPTICATCPETTFKKFPGNICYNCYIEANNRRAASRASRRLNFL